jgi:hypothetical protein
MLNVDNYSKQIEDFIATSIMKFTAENGVPVSTGIYCCPWAGWMTTNFNLVKTAGKVDYNCPDYEFVEFDFLDLAPWREEYETDSPAYKISGTVIIHRHELGDEKINEPVFSFLEQIVVKIKQSHQQEILLQMLDSACFKVI